MTALGPDKAGLHEKYLPALAGEKEFQALADHFPPLMWMANSDGWIYWYNSRWYEYTGTTPAQMEGWGWRAVHDPTTLPEVMERWTRSIATGEPFEMVFPLRGADGTYRPFLTRIRPCKNESGVVIRWFGTNIDVTEQKRAEDHLHFLLNELNHRVTNTLTTVQAIALHTFENVPRQQLDTFTDRLVALSRAHNLLIKGSLRQASLREIVTQAISFLPTEAVEQQFHIEGPTTAIAANHVPSWAMALHELCTNALRHGALQKKGSQVHVSWTIERRELVFRWIERGGPRVSTPSRRGFGSRLIDSIGVELGGNACVIYEPTGLVCTIVAPHDSGHYS
jgi:PAS domain S-box-containing protein